MPVAPTPSWKETPLNTETAAPSPPSRRERRLAARAAHTATGDRGRVNTAPRRGSPLVWITAVVGVVGALLVGSLLVLQGGTPKSVDVPSLQTPMSMAQAVLADGRTLGKADAPVTLEVWSDYQCPACGQFAEIVEPVLIREYVSSGTLRIVHHDAAFQGARSGVSYDESVEAGAAARCAAEQERYWPFHDWVFANQIGENKGAFGDERLRAMATAAGLDVVAWDACRATGEQQAAVRTETAQGLAQGVNATPTMYLNGQAMVGLRSAAELSQLVEAAAAAAR